jgi:hypothetical protein
MIITSIRDTKHWLQELETPAHIAGARHLNPALAMCGGVLWICWRVELSNGLSRLAFGRLDLVEDRYVIAGSEWVGMTAEHNAEDPRLCRAGGDLWLCYSVVRNPGNVGWQVTQCVRKICPWSRELGPEITPHWGRNGRDCEKNWTPFEHEGRLHMHYGPQIGGVWDAEAGREVRAIGSRPLAWPWGYFSGRSQGLPYRGGWLAIGGGAIMHASRGKRYFLGGWTINRETLQIDQVGRRPWVWASDDDPSLPCPRSIHYNPSVVFSGGAEWIDNRTLLVPAGIHDSWMCLLTVSIDDLNLVDAAGELDHRTTEREDAVPPPGCLLVRASCHIAEPGGPYRPGEYFFTPRRRADALGPLVAAIR